MRNHAVARSALEAEDLPEEVVQAAESALDRKAENVLALDLRGISTATDFFILATGNSDIQVRSIAEHIMEELGKSAVGPSMWKVWTGPGGS